MALLVKSQKKFESEASFVLDNVNNKFEILIPLLAFKRLSLTHGMVVIWLAYSLNFPHFLNGFQFQVPTRKNKT